MVGATGATGPQGPTGSGLKILGTYCKYIYKKDDTWG